MHRLLHYPIPIFNGLDVRHSREELCEFMAKLLLAVATATAHLMKIGPALYRQDSHLVVAVICDRNMFYILYTLNSDTFNLHFLLTTLGKYIFVDSVLYFIRLES